MNQKKADGKERIYAALCEQAKKKPVEKVTVTEIIQHAGINRSTFYYHFQDITHVLDRMMGDFLSEYLPLFEIEEGKTDINMDPQILKKQEEEICRLIMDRKCWLNLFFRPFNQKRFRDAFWKAFQDLAGQHDLVIVKGDGQISKIKRGYIYDYCLRTQFAYWYELLYFWYERDFSETAEDFVALFNKTDSGVIAFRGGKS